MKMQRIQIKKPNGQLVGYYECEDNGDKTIRDYTGRILGYYSKSYDRTMDHRRSIIAYGDVSGVFFSNILSY
jgi:hypothetical protein